MDEMLCLNGGFVSKLLTKVLEHEIRKKCRCEVKVTLNALTLNSVAEDNSLIKSHLDVEAIMKQQDLKQLVSKALTGGD